MRDWIDDRTGYRSVLQKILLLNFPVDRAARWRYVWGGSLALMFLVELVTGTLLMTVYSPSEAAAWGSVHYLENHVAWGGFIRGVHHYTSHMMLIVILMHALMVVVTAGYRRPREFTYWTGLILGGLVLGLAISGNPLPWDSKGYWAYQIETGIAGTMPGIGSTLRALLVGGSEFGNLTLTRLYTMHVVVLPALAILMLVIHMALMRREKLLIAKNAKMANLDTPQNMEPYWPYQTTRNLVVFAVLMGLIVLQLTVYPTKKAEMASGETAQWEPDVSIEKITIEAPADPEVTYVARPEWYVRFLFELRHMVDKEDEVYVTAGLPIAILVFLFSIPFFDNVLGRRLGHALALGIFVCGLGGALYITYDGIHRDRTDSEFQQSRVRELQHAGRAIWLADRNGIPPEGPAGLLRNDPKIAGPRLFKTHCASCHTWDGHDGTGKVIEEVADQDGATSGPTASDLSGFGTVDWIVAFLTNPGDEKFFGHMSKIGGGEEFSEGVMVDWAAEHVGEDGMLTAEQIHAVAALLAEESGRTDGQTLADETRQLGQQVFASGLLDGEGEELEFVNCLQCHELRSGDPDEAGSDGLETSPDLNGYASEAWLKEFIRDPAGEKFYPEKNIMPAFSPTEISDQDLELLVKWMRNEWPRNGER